MYSSPVPGFDVTQKPFNAVTWGPGSGPLSRLALAYPGLTFSRLRVWSNSVEQMLSGEDIFFGIWLTVRGNMETLIESRLMHPEWKSVARKGHRYHCKDGFGSANVYRLKSGLYALRDLQLEHALDLLAPVLLPFQWQPPAKICS